MPSQQDDKIAAIEADIATLQSQVFQLKLRVAALEESGNQLTRIAVAAETLAARFGKAGGV